MGDGIKPVSAGRPAGAQRQAVGVEMGRRRGAVGIHGGVGFDSPGEEALRGLGLRIHQEDTAILTHAAGHQPLAAGNLEQVFRFIQAADEVKTHGRGAGRLLRAGMRHAGGGLREDGQRQCRK